MSGYKSTCVLSRLPFWLGLAIIFVMALTVSAQAATIQEGTDDPCSFILEGPIVAGDFDKLAAFGTRLRDDTGVWYRNGQIWKPRVCLNSPGGSLAEGAKIARFVYEAGLTTRVGDGSICHSVCAIIFMMAGSGRGTVEQSRMLHIGGDLAFHSPSIVIEGPQRYSAEELKRAYALGVESILNIVKLANAPRGFSSSTMIHPGLIQALLDTPATDLLHISTIEQALTWEIGLEGVPEHLPQLEIQKLMTCENGLSRAFRRPSVIYARYENHFMTPDVFAFTPLSGGAQYRLLWDHAAEDLENGLVFGFRYWDLPVECEVEFREDHIEFCAVDSYFHREIGDCRNGYKKHLPSYARYHPLTEFRTLRDTGISADVLRSAHCSWRSSGGTVLNEGACIQSIDIFKSGDRKFARHTLHWNSQERTILEVSARPYYSDAELPDIYRVDGMQAEPLDDSGKCLWITGRNTAICVTDP